MSKQLNVPNVARFEDDFSRIFNTAKEEIKMAGEEFKKELKEAFDSTFNDAKQETTGD